MAATITARPVGSPRDVVTDRAYPAVDPFDRDEVTEVGRQIAKEYGVKRGGLKLSVHGGGVRPYNVVV